MNRSGRLRRIQTSRFVLYCLFLALTLSTCVLSAAEEGVMLIPHAPITILDDSQFTPEFGVTEGSGTPTDPYIIRGYEIDTTEQDYPADRGDFLYGIHIEGTTKSFRIEHCTVAGASSTGIKLVDVQDAVIEDCTIILSEFGIGLNNVQHSTVQHNWIQSCGYISIFLSASNQNSISNNTMTDGGMGIYLSDESMNNTISDNVISCAPVISIQTQCGGNAIYRNDFYKGWGRSNDYNRWESMDREGNYWQTYSGVDRDHDGIGDTPYRLLGETYEHDFRPAMSPFHPDRLLQIEDSE